MLSLYLAVFVVILLCLLSCCLLYLAVFGILLSLLSCWEGNSFICEFVRIPLTGLGPALQALNLCYLAVFGIVVSSLSCSFFMALSFLLLVLRSTLPLLSLCFCYRAVFVVALSLIWCCLCYRANFFVALSFIFATGPASYARGERPNSAFVIVLFSCDFSK